jgi:hypothetical protein
MVSAQVYPRYPVAVSYIAFAPSQESDTWFVVRRDSWPHFTIWRPWQFSDLLLSLSVTHSHTLSLTHSLTHPLTHSLTLNNTLLSLVSENILDRSVKLLLEIANIDIRGCRSPRNPWQIIFVLSETCTCTEDGSPLSTREGSDFPDKRDVWCTSVLSRCVPRKISCGTENCFTGAAVSGGECLPQIPSWGKQNLALYGGLQ